MSSRTVSRYKQRQLKNRKGAERLIPWSSTTFLKWYATNEDIAPARVEIRKFKQKDLAATDNA